MNRMKVLFGKRRALVLVTLSILVVASAALYASSASFTATAANAGNIFTSGSLAFSRDNTGAIVAFETPVMRPGDSVSGTVQVTNTGDVPGAFTLTKTMVAENANLAGRLTLVIQEQNPASHAAIGLPVFNNTIGTAMSKAILGTWNKNTVHEYKFTVTWDNTGKGTAAQDNADTLAMGKTCNYTFTWDAVADNSIN